MAVVVLAILLSVLARLLAERAAEGEAMAVRVMLNNLRSQLVILESTVRARLEKEKLAALEGGNPMAWIEEAPAGSEGPIEWQPQTPGSYIGSCRERPTGKTGVWCFDAGREEDKGVLRYFPHVELEGDFEAAYNGRDAYVWRVAVTGQGHLSLESVGEPER
mgnify:CR=1 FL=1